MAAKRPGRPNATRSDRFRRRDGRRLPAAPRRPCGNGKSDSYIASETGEIYFRSPELLDGNQGVPNAENVYVYREGRPRFVVALSPGNGCHERGNGGELICSHGAVVRMEVTPNGDHMAFITPSQVTAYENHGFLEMYSYDPAPGA